MANKAYDWLYIPASFQYIPNGFSNVQVPSIEYKWDDVTQRMEFYDILGQKISSISDFVKEQRVALKAYAAMRAGRTGPLILGDAVHPMSNGPLRYEWTRPWDSVVTDSVLQQATGYPQINELNQSDARDDDVYKLVSSTELSGLEYRIIRAAEGFEDNVIGIQLPLQSWQDGDINFFYPSLCQDFITTVNWTEGTDSFMTANFLMGTVEAVLEPSDEGTHKFVIVRKNSLFNVRDLDALNWADSGLTFGYSDVERDDVKINDDTIVLKTEQNATVGSLIELSYFGKVIDAVDGFVWRKYDDGSDFLEDGSTESYAIINETNTSPSLYDEGYNFGGFCGIKIGDTDIMVRDTSGGVSQGVLPNGFEHIANFGNIFGKYRALDAQITKWKGYWHVIADVDLETIPTISEEDFPKYYYSVKDNLNWFDQIWLDELRTSVRDHRPLVLGGRGRGIDQVRAFRDNEINEANTIFDVYRYGPNSVEAANIFYEDGNGSACTDLKVFVRDLDSDSYIKTQSIDAEYTTVNGLYCSQSKSYARWFTIDRDQPGDVYTSTDYSGNPDYFGTFGGTDTVDQRGDGLPDLEPLTFGNIFRPYRITTNLWQVKAISTGGKIPYYWFTDSPQPLYPSPTLVTTRDDVPGSTWYYYCTGPCEGYNIPDGKTNTWDIRCGGETIDRSIFPNQGYLYRTSATIDIPYNEVFSVQPADYRPPSIPGDLQSANITFVGPKWTGQKDWEVGSYSFTGGGVGDFYRYIDTYDFVSSSQYIVSSDMFIANQYGTCTGELKLDTSGEGDSLRQSQKLRYVREEFPTIKAVIDHVDVVGSNSAVDGRNALDPSYQNDLMADVLFYNESTKYAGETVVLKAAKVEDEQFGSWTRTGQGSFSFSNNSALPNWNRIVFETDRIAIPRLILGSPKTFLGTTVDELALDDEDQSKVWSSTFTRISYYNIGVENNLIPKIWRAANLDNIQRTDYANNIEIQTGFLRNIVNVNVVKPEVSFDKWESDRIIKITGLSDLEQRYRVFTSKTLLTNFDEEPDDLILATNKDGVDSLLIELPLETEFYIYVEDLLLCTMLRSKPYLALGPADVDVEVTDQDIPDPSPSEVEDGEGVSL